VTEATTRKPATSELFLHFTFTAMPARPTFHSVTELLGGIEPLLVAGYWVAFDREGMRTPPVFDPLPDIQEGVRVERFTFRSPLDLWLTLPPSIGTGLIAARGVIYLFKSFQKARAVKYEADTAKAGADVARAQADVSRLRPTSPSWHIRPSWTACL
jgi:hypothetical protein